MSNYILSKDSKFYIKKIENKFYIRNVQPPSVLLGGAFTATDPGLSFINKAGRLNSNGTLDNTFSIGTGFNNDPRSFAVQADGKILVGGGFTIYNGIGTNLIARLNSDGTLDNTFSIGTGFTSTVWSIAIQADGKILVGGQFTSYNGTSTNRIARLNSDGTLDNTFSIGTGFNNTVRSVAVQADGKILVGGLFTSYNGTSTNRIARLNSDGSLDNTFSIGSGFNSTVFSVAIQADGKILVGGEFTSYNGTSTNRIARLNSDGTLDNTFSIGTGFTGTLYSIVIQSDSKILVGGGFFSYNGTSTNRIARLNSDGTLDNTFSIGTGFDNTVWSVAIQADSKILIGGQFTSYNGTSSNRIARLNSNGTLDNAFSIGTGFNSNVVLLPAVYSMVIQGDGKILVGGDFNNYNGTSRNRIAGLNSDGALYNTFSIGTGFNNTVRSIDVQSDGKILIGGDFNNYNGTSINRIARLNSDGTLDNTFSIGTGSNSIVSSVVIQGDGKILFGGYFSIYNGTSTSRIARLNSDGTLDNTFSTGTGFNNAVLSVAIQGDGKILVGGFFTSYNGTSVNYMARLNSDGTLDNSFNIGTGFSNSVNSVAVQDDGKILLGGQFESYNGTSRKYIARLNSDGTFDDSFSIGTGFTGTVNSVAVQDDGKILAGGGFISYNGSSFFSNNRIARLNSDGTLDNTFTIGTGFNSTVNSIAIQDNGKILVGGQFTSYNGASRNRMARLNGDGTLDDNFDFDTNNTVTIVI